MDALAQALHALPVRASRGLPMIFTGRPSRACTRRLWISVPSGIDVAYCSALPGVISSGLET